LLGERGVRDTPLPAAASGEGGKRKGAAGGRTAFFGGPFREPKPGGRLRQQPMQKFCRPPQCDGTALARARSEAPQEKRKEIANGVYAVPAI